ncbi:MAG: sulfatase-like hydrolase/transferase [Fuerstiella sp.]
MKVLINNCLPVLSLLAVFLGDVGDRQTSAAEATGAERPNILFIFTDDQSYRTVSCYPEAYDWVHTPNIDALAKMGVRFTHAYVGTWCMPSRATMLTGHHQYGVESMRMQGTYPGSVYDPEQCPFWPRVFRENGYSTCQIGKWHTGIDSGFGRDWDHQIVWSRPKYPENAGSYYDDQIVEIDGVKQRMSGYTTDWYTDRAIDFINGEHRDAKQPWYLWLCYGAVHGPFTPADRHQAAYPEAQVPVPADIYPESPLRKDKPAYVRERSRWVKGADGEPELESGVQQRTVKNAPIHGNSLQNWVRQYHQGVLAIDNAVGRLVTSLQESGQAENTLIVFAADQGIAWGQKGFQQKIAPYDANIRGPLIFSFPGRIPAGKVCRSPVGGVDIPPTFFGFAGLPLPWKMHGHDLAPLLQKPDHAWPHPVLTALTGEKYGSDTNKVPTDPEVLYKTARVPWWISLLDGRHKYIRTLVKGEVEELYDLEKDPEELVNLAMKPKHRQLLKRLRAATLAELRRTEAGLVESLPATGTP